MKKFRGLLAIAVVIMIGMASCSKTGDAGPTGPAGPAGPDSVLYSNWISLSFINNGDGTFGDTLSAPAITPDILDKGVVLSYVDLPDSNGLSHVVAVSAISTFIIEDYSVGKINLLAFDDYTELPYRYVVIPGSMVVNSGDKAKVGAYTVGELKTMPFEQVQKALSQVKN